MPVGQMHRILLQIAFATLALLSTSAATAALAYTACRKVCGTTTLVLADLQHRLDALQLRPGQRFAGAPKFQGPFAEADLPARALNFFPSPACFQVEHHAMVSMPGHDGKARRALSAPAMMAPGRSFAFRPIGGTVVTVLPSQPFTFRLIHA